jgi:hypothetical protein
MVARSALISPKSAHHVKVVVAVATVAVAVEEEAEEDSVAVQTAAEAEDASQVAVGDDKSRTVG